MAMAWQSSFQIFRKAWQVPQICFVQSDGTRHRVEEECGVSVMRAAVNNRIDGIVAECGGNAACGTCHVYLSEETMALVPPPNASEVAMLEFTATPSRPTSRLSCQINLDHRLEGAVFTIAERQI
jgi:2Fe-2S ferredoxin